MPEHNTKIREGDQRLIVLTRRNWLIDEWEEEDPVSKIFAPFSPLGLKQLFPIEAESMCFQRLLSGEGTDRDKSEATELLVELLDSKEGPRLIRADLWELKIWLPSLVSVWGREKLSVIQISDHSRYFQAVDFATTIAIRKSAKGREYDVEGLSYRWWTTVVHQCEDWDLLFAGIGIDPVFATSQQVRTFLEDRDDQWLESIAKDRVIDDGAFESVMKQIEAELRRQLVSSKPIWRAVGSDTLIRED